MRAGRTASAARRGFAVACAECRRVHGLPAYRCEACGGPLVLTMPPLPKPDATCAELPEPGTLLPEPDALLPATRHRVTLGEGRTPLLPAPWATPDAPEPGAVHLALESLQPTLSFKDRAMALGAAMALDLGLTGLVLASTGNAAVSAAAYAAAAGLRCRIVGTRASADGPAATKLAMAASFGADVELVEGDYSAAHARVGAYVRDHGDTWFDVTTTYRNPVLTPAYRAIAVELVEALGGVPDAVVVPVGAGPLLTGVYDGFVDLEPWTGRVPRMVGVQAEACAPLARAWSAPDWVAALAQPTVAVPTVADAIADPLRGYEREGLLTLATARASRGFVAAVSEGAIELATRELAAHGIAVEPAAAAALIPAARLALAGSRTVAILTGHAAKDAPTAPLAKGFDACDGESEAMWR